MKFWGVRGSYPTPEKDKMAFGGDTSCVEIRTHDNDLIILDMGTGIRNLGKAILNDKNYPKEINIVLSHYHWDHIMGFFSFAPLYSSEYTVNIYGYNKNQILQTSDRITINAKKDHLFLSSIGNIHIGAGNNLTISVNNDLIIDSRNIYLGKPYDGNESFEMEPMVLGQELANVLNDLITCLSTAHFISPAGAPLPLIDQTQAPIATTPGANRKSLKTIQGEINKILSSYHFIEKNGQTNK